MNNKSIAIITILVLLAGGIYLATKMTSTPVAPVSLPAAPTSTTKVSPAGVSVNYTANGFSPKTVTIKQGQSVTWINQTGDTLWVASNPHPQHTEYDGTTRTEHCANVTSTTFDACAPNNAYTFTFTKVGTWNYHNHAEDGNTGTVIVTQ